MFSSHLTAVLQAFLVTFLWSLSVVLIKIGLQEIPALSFAGMRYFLAFLVLLPLTVRSKNIRIVQSFNRHDWFWLAVLGLVFYTVAQGSWFLALDHLPAVTVGLILNFTPVVVALMGIVYLREYPTRFQWGGMAVFGIGVIIYFYPIVFLHKELLGIGIAIVTMLANSVGSVIGRYVNRAAKVPALIVTIVSMGFGSIFLFIAGVVNSGFPVMSVDGWVIILILAVVNTALAFTMWNHSLRVLSAVESSLIVNTMLIQVAVLGWVFLGEGVTLQEAIGMAIAAMGILVVQLRV